MQSLFLEILDIQLELEPFIFNKIRIKYFGILSYRTSILPITLPLKYYL
jgi:hypothetical protein